MKNYFNTLSVIALLLAIVFGSCREDFEFVPSPGSLEFSKDTVFLDTIFTNIGSSTYSLKVYNRSNENILIPQVVLKNGEESKYRLNVDGVAGNSFQDVSLLAKDSLFVFIETTFDISSTGDDQFLHTDAILFGDSGNFQNVELVTLVRDAIFLFPRTESDGSKESLLLGSDEEGNEIRIEGFVLEDSELLFTAEKPYVIYGYAAVSEGKTLTIEAGARVHFHKDSGILVGTGGSLNIDGTLSTDYELMENQVVFEGDRLEPDFDDVPGQWGTIWLAPGSIDNSISHLTIKNATVGLLVDGGDLNGSPILTLFNSQIHNSLSIGLWARNSKLDVQNTVLGSAGTFSLYCNLGGDYSFKHCTIANYWNQSFRNTPALFIDDNIEISSGQFITENLFNASFSNCIIDGGQDLEVLFSRRGDGEFRYSFLNCAIKFRDSRQEFIDNPLYDFTNTDLFQDILQNPFTQFLDTANGDFRLTIESEVLDLGDTTTALEVPFDILGIDRTEAPDLGAFELNQ